MLEYSPSFQVLESMGCLLQDSISQGRGLLSSLAVAPVKGTLALDTW